MLGVGRTHAAWPTHAAWSANAWHWNIFVMIATQHLSTRDLPGISWSNNQKPPVYLTTHLQSWRCGRSCHQSLALDTQQCLTSYIWGITKSVICQATNAYMVQQTLSAVGKSRHMPSLMTYKLGEEVVQCYLGGDQYTMYLGSPTRSRSLKHISYFYYYLLYISYNASHDLGYN
jgi:hypothetical protein